jgi:septal ring factor EnvC (AmiA/AmiB activator)
VQLSDVITAASNLGIATFFVVIMLWGLWRYIVPALINRWDDAERARTDREQAMHSYYRAEIKSLQDESRADKIKVLEAFQENTLTMSKTNDLLIMLAKQLEEQGKDLDEIKKFIQFCEKERK